MQQQLLQQPIIEASLRGYERLRAWLRTPEGLVVWASLLGHLLLQALLLACMPLAYFSELSGHDGDSYYVLAQLPLPAAPMFSLMRYKRVFFPLLARTAWPWDAHVGFLIVGIAGMVLASLYFYRIAALYTPRPLRVVWLFSCGPYLFAAAHLALPDTLSVAMILAALFYLLRGHFGPLVLCSALALLFKEVSAVAVLALALLVAQRMGWWRALLFLGLAGLPTLGIWAAYALAWGDWGWYLKESRSTWLPAPITLVRLLADATLPPIQRLDSAINLGLLALLAAALWRLRRLDRALLLYCAVCVVPLLFLDERQYQSDFDMARQYMVAAPALLAFAAPLQRMRGWMFRLLLGGMLLYGLYYILSISKFFLTYKAVILQLLSQLY